MHMGEKLKKIWHDPVWSKVIAALILTILSLLGGTLWKSGASVFGISVPLWLVVVVAAGTFAVSVVMMSGILRSIYGFTPELNLVSEIIPDPDPNQAWTFPLKCFVQFRNDSRGCIDVSISDYEPQAVTLKSLGIAVLQVQLNQKWLPADHGMNRLAVLPGQLLQGWIAPDETKFNSTQVRNLKGSLGTLTLLVNGKKLKYKL